MEETIKKSPLLSVERNGNHLQIEIKKNKIYSIQDIARNKSKKKSYIQNVNKGKLGSIIENKKEAISFNNQIKKNLSIENSQRLNNNGNLTKLKN